MKPYMLAVALGAPNFRMPKKRKAKEEPLWVQAERQRKAEEKRKRKNLKRLADNALLQLQENTCE